MKTISLSILLSAGMLLNAQSKGTQGGKEPPRGPAHPGLMNPASLKATAPPVFKALFSTTKGDFTVEVHRDWSPNGADRFYNLVKNGFFDGCEFFRVVPNFMVQFGISGNPRIAAAWGHANLRDDPLKEGNKRGRITFANAGPNTRSTQLFINFKDNSFLDGQNFPAFGEVIDNGMEVVDKIYSGYGDMPGMGGHGPDPSKIETEGNAYLDKNFSQLDKIKTAKIVP